LSAEDIEWIIPGEDWPLAGTHRGHAGLNNLVQKANETVETSYPEPPEFIAQGDRVLVVGFARGRISKPRIGRSRTIGSSPLPFEMAKCRTSVSMSTREHWRGPPRRPRAPGPDPSRCFVSAI
jgi:hypothetical protein